MSKKKARLRARRRLMLSKRQQKASDLKDIDRKIGYVRNAIMIGERQYSQGTVNAMKRKLDKLLDKRSQIVKS